MIPIRHDRLEGFADKHYQAVREKLKTAHKVNRIDEWNERISSIWQDETLESIILAKPEKLEKLASEWDGTHNSTFQYFIPNLYEEYRGNDNWRLYNAPQLVRDLGITVCPYCNQNFIFNIDSTRRTTYQIDHFFPKEKYPFLAVSFYNLIPSCSSCNHLKSDDCNTNDSNLIINPYDSRINGFFNFEFQVRDSDFYHKPSSLKIKFNCSKSFSVEEQEKWQKRIENHIEIFQLEDRYSNHKDIALEIIQRKYTYSEDYLKSLFRMYEGSVFSSREDLERLVHSNYIQESNFSKRPLSKLTSDLLKQLEG